MRNGVQIDHDILRLYVAMNDIERMRIVEGGGERREVVLDALDGHRPGRDLAGQGFALNERRDEVQQVVLLAEIEDGNNVWMRETCDGARFGPEPGNPFVGKLIPTGLDYLNCDA